MRLGLRARFTLALLALGLIPLGITTAVLLTYTVDELMLSQRNYRVAAADTMEQTIWQLLGRARGELEAVGAAVAQREIPLDDRTRLARTRLLAGEFIHRVALYDARGEHVFTLRAGDEKETLERPDQLSEGVRGPARTEGVVYYPVRRSPGGRWRMPLVVPLYQGAKRALYGYLWTGLDLTPLSTDVSDLSKRRFSLQADRIYIVDHELRIVAHADPTQIGRSFAKRGAVSDLKGGGAFRSDFALGTDYAYRGEALLGVIKPVPKLSWLIVVEQLRSEAYAAVHTTLKVVLGVGAAFVLAALLIGLYMGRGLSGPVIAVAQAADRVAGGDFDVRVPARGGAEVGQMASSFNKMASDLGEYQRRITEEARIRTDLGRYLSAELVEQIVSKEADLELGGERRTVTVLFADVVAFTPLAERHRPEHVVGILNELFTFLTEIVFKHGGTVDKFIGDCVMAVFGAPYHHADDALRAVRAAEEMMRWLEAGNARWRKELGRELQLGIGVHTGLAVAGNVGSSKRMEYTVIGDTVNIAARLEALAQPGQILMTRATAEAIAEEFDSTSLGQHALAGRLEQVELFELEED